MGAVLLAWLTEIGVQVWKGGAENKVPPGLPVPSLFAADMLVFGLLAFGAKESAQARPVVGLLAWGLVAATLLNNPLAPSALAKKLVPGSSSTTASPSTGAQLQGVTQ
jgi:hypothetical protein